MTSGKLSLQTRWKLNDGHSIPILGFGTYKMPGTEAEKPTLYALKTGYRHIDTAALYENEAEVGRAVREAEKKLGVKRKAVFVTTKIWNADHGNPRQALEKSLHNLRMDYVDLYLIHWPVPQSLNTWKQFERFQEEGKCRSIGVSNFGISDLELLLERTEVAPAVNQVEFSPFLYQKELLEYCNKHAILVEAYSPLTRGRKLGEPLLLELAEKYGKTAAQLLIRWCLQHGTVPLPKSAHVERIEENADVFDFSISAKDMKKMDGLHEDLHTGWNPSSGLQKRFVDLVSPLKRV